MGLLKKKDLKLYVILRAQILDKWEIEVVFFPSCHNIYPRFVEFFFGGRWRHAFKCKKLILKTTTGKSKIRLEKLLCT